MNVGGHGGSEPPAMPEEIELMQQLWRDGETRYAIADRLDRSHVFVWKYVRHIPKHEKLVHPRSRDLIQRAERLQSLGFNSTEIAGILGYTNQKCLNTALYYARRRIREYNEQRGRAAVCNE